MALDDYCTRNENVTPGSTDHFLSNATKGDGKEESLGLRVAEYVCKVQEYDKVRDPSDRTRPQRD